MPFVAPEVLAGVRYDPSLSDTWAAGVVLLEMICGINKLPEMLKWGSAAIPSSARANDLMMYFSTPQRMLQDIGEDLGEFRGGLDVLLSGVLRVPPEDRWTSARARDCEWARLGAARAPIIEEAQDDFLEQELEESEGDVSDADVRNPHGDTGGTAGQHRDMEPTGSGPSSSSTPC
mmetsp:Transcript_29656/g.82794  ORF Transcript_29656/g.82794 Transcript_29656/m.82794 type:complete len:176 (-) Transcript_29656:112-639(-)